MRFPVFPIVALAVLAAAPARAEVALHKALYDLSMVSVTSGAGIVGIKGTMYFEQDDACDAWTTDQRFTMEYQYPERRPVNNTNRYVAWEGKDGHRFEFNSERQENGELTEILRGSAERGADGAGMAQYTRPGGLKYALPKGYFLPVAHTAEIFRRARLGDTFFNATMFDGTDSEGPVDITVVIGKEVPRAEVEKLAGSQADKSLLASPARRVRMAVFPVKDKEELTPAYEMDMVLHENGVISHAIVEYRNFKVEQKLRTLEKISPPHCP